MTVDSPAGRKLKPKMLSHGSPLFRVKERDLAAPGLYFVGQPFLYSMTSSLIGGVGRDAEHIADHIVARRDGSAAAASGAGDRGSPLAAARRTGEAEG